MILRRLTAAFSLLILMSPLALATTVTDPETVASSCYEIYGGGDLDSATSDDVDALFLNIQEDIENGKAASLGCGTPDANGVLEKGVCTNEGAVITEIIEPIAPSTSLSSGEKIIDVYKGVCCAQLEKTSTGTGESAKTETVGCSETRSVYFDDFSDCNSLAAHCVKGQWLISETGVGIIKVFVKQIYVLGAAIAGFLAMVVMVVSGIQIAVSGVSGDITSAKQRILQSIAGLALLFLSGILLYTINPTFFS